MLFYGLYHCKGGTVDLIYLRGNHSTISSGLINPDYADLASRRVQLLKSKRRAPPVPSDVKSADITMHNVSRTCIIQGLTRSIFCK